MKLGMQVGLGPGDFVLDGHPVPPEKKGAQPPSNFRPMSIVTKRMDGSKCHLVRRYKPRPRRRCVIDGVTAPPKRGTAPSFRLMCIVAKWLDG